MSIEKLPFENENGDASPKSLLEEAMRELVDKDILGNFSVSISMAMDALERGVSYTGSVIGKSEMERIKNVLNSPKG